MSYIDYLEDESFDYVEELISQFKVKIGQQSIKIRITQDSLGYYQFETSHFYHGSKQAGPYIVSAANFKSEKEAIMHARKQIVSFYDPEDINAVWVENSLY